MKLSREEIIDMYNDGDLSKAEYMKMLAQCPAEKKPEPPPPDPMAVALKQVATVIEKTAQDNADAAKKNTTGIEKMLGDVVKALSSKPAFYRIKDFTVERNELDSIVRIIPNYEKI